MDTCIIASFSYYHTRPYEHLYYFQITKRGHMNTCIIVVLFSDYHSRRYDHLYYFLITTRGPMNTCIIVVLFPDYDLRPYEHLYYCRIIFILPLAVLWTPVLLLYYFHITTRGPMNTCIIAVLSSYYHSRPYEHVYYCRIMFILPLAVL